MIDIIIALAVPLLGGLLYVFYKFVIDPIKELHKCFADITSSLSYYSNILADVRNNQDQRRSEASDKFRQLAASLEPKKRSIKLYNILERFKVVKKQECIDAVTTNLYHLSNSMTPNAGEEYSREKGRENLSAKKEIESILST